MHTTHYTDTLILPAPDTKAQTATAPPTGKGTVAELQYDRLSAGDYLWTSDDLLFDPDGRIALLPMDSARVAELEADPAVTVRAAMKSSR